jgi:hypothetical protein
LHLRDQIVHHEQDVPREFADEKMTMGDQSLVDLMMAWMMKDVQKVKMMKGAKKDDR